MDYELIILFALVEIAIENIFKHLHLGCLYSDAEFFETARAFSASKKQLPLDGHHPSKGSCFSLFICASAMV